MEDSLEEIHEELLVWAESVGVKINGIRPMRLSGRGFGIVATENLMPDTEILTVPISALRTKDTVTPALAKRLPLPIASSTSSSKSKPKDQNSFTVHGLLAADLTLNTPANTHTYAKWAAVVPTWADLQLVMPLVWPASLQALLPTTAAKLLAEQREKFERDWAIVSAAFPFPSRVSGRGSASASASNGDANENDPTATAGGSIAPTCTKQEYLYAWLLVNTRTFYFVTPQTAKELPKADHMALQPVADLFNHTDRDGCAVVFGPTTTYSFRTTRAYEKGEEVHISYGSHANDFLLVEYGFVLGDIDDDDDTSNHGTENENDHHDDESTTQSTPLPSKHDGQNQWDELRLDDALLPSLSPSQQEDLEDVGFLGNYTLDRQTVCHRTQVALRLLLTSVPAHRGGITMNSWRRFVSGLDDGEKSQRAAEGLLVQVLKEYDEGVVEERLEALEGLRFDDGGEDGEDVIDGGDAVGEGQEEGKWNNIRRDMLRKRWLQIRTMISETIRRLT
ncbi:hypothetical protein BD289DRAFT_506428 [Coniella lustricola]|uniref:SET domain-containing protein n=1 Tax=Coniella lustricola TaxID=2025994 RepID=A0A2T3A6K9_9PEZI|nr:hypothetical protein BD289DRAFT_506428 [Coniella lustricola]